LILVAIVVNMDGVLPVVEGPTAVPTGPTPLLGEYSEAHCRGAINDVEGEVHFVPDVP
jgi:hypothetical protein